MGDRLAHLQLGVPSLKVTGTVQDCVQLLQYIVGGNVIKKKLNFPLFQIHRLVSSVLQQHPAGRRDRVPILRRSLRSALCH